MNSLLDSVDAVPGVDACVLLLLLLLSLCASPPSITCTVVARGVMYVISTMVYVAS